MHRFGNRSRSVLNGPSRSASLRLPRNLRCSCVLGLSLVAAASLALATGRNLAPDAVTRATTWNEHEGDVAWLTDGIVPPTVGARAFQWDTKGVLVFAWQVMQPVARIRIRVGDVANDYQVALMLAAICRTKAPRGIRKASRRRVSKTGPESSAAGRRSCCPPAPRRTTSSCGTWGRRSSSRSRFSRPSRRR